MLEMHAFVAGHDAFLLLMFSVALCCQVVAMTFWECSAPHIKRHPTNWLRASRNSHFLALSHSCDLFELHGVVACCAYASCVETESATQAFR